MDTWHQYTLRANTEFQLAFYGNAILMHNQALDFARHNFADHAQRCVYHALARVVISHFSLADCYHALQEIPRAAECYLEAQQFLLRCRDELAHSAEMSRVLEEANTQLHLLWNELLQKHSDAVPRASRLAYHNANRSLLDITMGTEVLH